MKEKAGGKRSRGAIIASVVALMCATILGLPSLGVALPFMPFILYLFSFSTNTNPLWLLPTSAFFLIVGIFLIVSRKRPVILTFQLLYTALITYTLHSLSHLLQESPWPIFRNAIITSSDGVRGASFKLVLAFIAEMVLLIIIMLIADALKHRKRAVKKEDVSEETETITLTPKPAPPLQDFPKIDDLPHYVDRTPPPPPLPRAKREAPPPAEEISGENTVSLAMFRRLSEEVKRREEEQYKTPTPSYKEPTRSAIDEKKGAKELPGLMLAAVKRMEEQKEEPVVEK